MRWVLVLLSAASIGCLSGEICQNEPCPVPAIDECEGVCAPFVGAGWEPVLVAPSSRSARPRCPAVAPAEALATTVITACGVPEVDGECGAGRVCLAGEEGWIACVVRDGAHACPASYEEAVAQAEGVTLCCPRDEPPA